MRLASGAGHGNSRQPFVGGAREHTRGLHCKYAMTEGAVGTMAAQLYAPRQGRHLPKALSVDEVGRLLTRPRRRFYWPARRRPSSNSLRDGARVSEAVSLSADDLDLTETFCRAPVRKGRKERDRLVVVRRGRARRVPGAPAPPRRTRPDPRFSELPGGAVPAERMDAIRRAAQAFAQLGRSGARKRTKTRCA